MQNILLCLNFLSFLVFAVGIVSIDLGSVKSQVGRTADCLLYVEYNSVLWRQTERVLPCCKKSAPKEKVLEALYCTVVIVLFEQSNLKSIMSKRGKIWSVFHY